MGFKGLVQVDDLRCTWLPGELGDLFTDVLVAVKGARAHILDDEAGVVIAGEFLQIGVDQNVNAFAGDGATTEEEFEFLLRQAVDERRRRGLRIKNLGLNGKRDDLDLVRIDTVGDETVSSVIGECPDFVDLVLERF